MSELTIHRVDDVASATLQSNEMYLSRSSGNDLGYDNGHLAYRLVFTSTKPALSIAELVFADTTGSTLNFASTNTGSAVSAFDNNAGTAWSPSVVDQSFVGQIFATPQRLSVFTLNASGTDMPSGIVLQYSDDTTTGLDGTWTDQLTDNTPGLVSGTGKEFATGFALPEYAKVDITDINGGLVQGISQELITSKVKTALGSKSFVKEFADITARDAANLQANGIVAVADASGDPDVPSGKALYFYDDDDNTFSLIHTDAGGLILSATDW